MENNPLLLKTFTVNNQLDLDFYIRGRHEGADNSLCKKLTGHVNSRAHRLQFVIDLQNECLHHVRLLCRLRD